VNASLPSLEGRNIIDLKDLNGNLVVREEIDAAMKRGSAWLDMSWFKPGHNTPALKQTFVRKTQFGQDIYIVGSGIYREA
jgi:signal transduction histidine kinase